MNKYKIPNELLKETGAKDKIFSIRLNQNEFSDLEKLSKENNLSKNEVVRVALKNLIK